MTTPTVTVLAYNRHTGQWDRFERTPHDAVWGLFYDNSLGATYTRVVIQWGTVDARQWDMGGYLTHPVPVWPHN